jgi:hypothetical protein
MKKLKKIPNNIQQIRLIYLKGALRFLAGAKTLSGQTTSEKGGRSK